MRVRYVICWSRLSESLALTASILGLAAAVAGLV